MIILGVSAAECWLLVQPPLVSSSRWTLLSSPASSFRRLGRYRRSFLLHWFIFSCCAGLPAWRPLPSLLRWFWFPPLCPQGGLWRRSSAALPPSARHCYLWFSSLRRWAPSAHAASFSGLLYLSVYLSAVSGLPPGCFVNVARYHRFLALLISGTLLQPTCQVAVIEQ